MMEDFPLERKIHCHDNFLSSFFIFFCDFQQQTNKYIQLTIVFSSRVDNNNKIFTLEKLTKFKINSSILLLLLFLRLFVLAFIVASKIENYQRDIIRDVNKHVQFLSLPNLRNTNFIIFQLNCLQNVPCFFFVEKLNFL